MATMSFQALIVIFILSFFNKAFLFKEFILKNKFNFTKNFNPVLLQYSHDQSFLGAIDQSRNSFTIFDGRSLKELQSVKLNESVNLRCLKFSHNSKFFTLGDSNGFFYLYGRQKSIFTSDPIHIEQMSNQSQIKAIAFNNNDSIVAVGDWNGLIYFFNLTLLSISQLFSEQSQMLKIMVKKNNIDFQGIIYSMVFTPVNQNLLVGGMDKNYKPLMKLYNYLSRVVLHTFILDQNLLSVLSVASASDQQFFLNTGAFGNSDLKIEAWNGKNYTKLQSLTQNYEIFNDTIIEVLISDNNLYVAARKLGKIFIWQRNKLNHSFVFNKTIITNNYILALSSKEGFLLAYQKQEKILSLYTLCPTKQFYNSNDDSCKICNNQCQQCFGLNNNQCYSCPIKKYLNSGKCLSCINGCLQCQDEKFCKECDQINNWKLVEYACKCKQGYFQKNGVCENCNKIDPFCINCYNEKYCQCDFQNHRIWSNGTCICQKGYYLNSTVNICYPCIINGCLDCVQCLNCSKLTKCVKCDQSAFWIKDSSGSCKCQPRYGEINQKCLSCANPGCLKCAQTINKCVQCDQLKNWENLFNSTCTCKTMTYYDGYDLCANCQLGCTQCSGKQQCNSCFQDYNLLHGVCKCTLQNSFPNGQFCKPCISPCQTCLNQKYCLSCIQGYQLNIDIKNCEVVKSLFFIILTSIIFTIVIVIIAIRVFCIIRQQPQEKIPLPIPGGWNQDPEDGENVQVEK